MSDSEKKQIQVKKSHSPIVGHPNDIHNALIGNDASEALYGEIFFIDEMDGGWVKGKLKTDRYEGWLSLNDASLQEERFVVPHAYCAQVISAVFEEPHLKSRPLNRLSMMSPLSLDTNTTQGKYIAVKQGGWVHSDHIIATSEIGKEGKDLADIAKMFLGTPYLYGGRTGWGIDCSALVQICAARIGKSIPRDTSDQKEALSRHLIDTPSFHKAKRNDIVFLPGHIGIMSSETTIIHAFGHTMRVQEDPIQEVSEFYSEKHGEGLQAIARF